MSQAFPFVKRQTWLTSGVQRRLLRRKGAVFGAIVVLFFTALAILAPYVSPYDPLLTDWSAVRQAPSLTHWMGTDEIGRDILARLIWGTRASLLAGVVAVAIAFAVGVPLGLIAGYYQGWVGEVIVCFMNAMLSFPFLILAIALAAALGPNLRNAMIAIGISMIPIFISLTRGQVLAEKGKAYVSAVKSLGASDLRILLSHIFPSILSPLLVQSTLLIATAIIAEASLSFLGLGQQPPAPSWGSSLNVARSFLIQAPWMSAWPGIIIFLVVLAFNLFGDGLRDALDPKES